jgi:hypothetical protein
MKLCCCYLAASRDLDRSSTQNTLIFIIFFSTVSYEQKFAVAKNPLRSTTSQPTSGQLLLLLLGGTAGGWLHRWHLEAPSAQHLHWPPRSRNLQSVLCRRPWLLRASSAVAPQGFGGRQRVSMRGTIEQKADKGWGVARQIPHIVIAGILAHVPECKRTG